MCVCVFRLIHRAINISRDGLWTSLSEDSDCESPAAAPEDTTNVQPDDHGPSPTMPLSRVTYVRRAAAENTCDDVESTDR